MFVRLEAAFDAQEGVCWIDDKRHVDGIVLKELRYLQWAFSQQN